MKEHLYRVVIGTNYQVLVAAHSEEEAINTAVHNVLPGLRGERLAFEWDVASAELIKASMFDEPTMII